MYVMQPSMYASMSAYTAGNETTVISPGVAACVRIWVYWSMYICEDTQQYCVLLCTYLHISLQHLQSGYSL